jgi:hypothetical protein
MPDSCIEVSRCGRLRLSPTARSRRPSVGSIETGPLPWLMDVYLYPLVDIHPVFPRRWDSARGRVRRVRELVTVVIVETLRQALNC